MKDRTQRHDGHESAGLRTKETPGSAQTVHGAVLELQRTAGNAAVHRIAGEPLAADVRSAMEERLGSELGHVRVHADDDAYTRSRELGAAAFAQGADVTFSAGMYRPETEPGRVVLAHELAHVVQQTQNAEQPLLGAAQLEAEADAAAVHGEPVVGSAPLGSTQGLFHELVEKAEELLGSEEKSNFEITAEEFNGDLEDVIDKIEKAQKFAGFTGVKDLSEGLEGVAKGLKGVQGPLEKLLKFQEFFRDLRELNRTLNTLKTIDINADYEEGARAMSKLGEITGKFGERAFPPELGGGELNAAFRLIKESGKLFEMGARLRKDKEAQLDPDEYEKKKAADWAAMPTPPKETAAHKVALDDVGVFVVTNLDTALSEVKKNQYVLSNETPPWRLLTDAFRQPYDTFMGLQRQQQETPVYERLGSNYRFLKTQMKGPWKEAWEFLLQLEQTVGQRADVSVSYQPALAAFKAVRP